MHVKADVVIEATPEEVFRFITLPENGPRWQESAVSTRVTTPGPVERGTRMEHEGRWLWMRIPTTAIVTIHEPARRYGYEITSNLASAPSLMRYLLEPVARGTKLTLSNEAPFRGWMKLVEPLLERSVQRMFERDVARLKAVIEAEVAASVPTAREAASRPTATPIS
jgi:uncharacterized protein YndB with AHSA1/START domain